MLMGGGSRERPEAEHERAARDGGGGSVVASADGLAAVPPFNAMNSCTLAATPSWLGCGDGMAMGAADG